MSKGKICLFVSAFLYGVMPVLAELAYDGGLNGMTLTFLRGFISLPCVFSAARSRTYTDQALGKRADAADRNLPVI